MMIRRVAVRDFRVLRGAQIELGPGLNVIHGDNDAGKSTLMDAIRAAFTVPARRGGQAVEAMRSRFEQGHPQVEVVFESRGVEYLLRKKFGAGASTSLRATGAEAFVLSGQDAEARVRSLLGLGGAADRARPRDEHLAYWPLVWVRQGRSGMPVGEDLNDDARAALSERLATMGGDPLAGAGAEGLIRAVQAERDLWLTATGQVRAHSELAQAQAALGAARGEVVKLEAQRDAHERDVDRFARRDLERRELEARLPALDKEAAEALDALEAVRARLGQRQTEAAKLEARRLGLEQAHTLASARAQLRGSISRGLGLATEIAGALEQARAALGRHDETFAARRAELDRVAGIREAADRSRRRAHAHLEALGRSEEALQLAQRLALAREAGDALAALEARRALLDEVDEAAVASIEKLGARATRARAELDAAKAAVRVRALGRVALSIDGEERTLEQGEAHEVASAEPIVVCVPGVVQVDVTPGGVGLARLREEAHKAEERVTSALAKLGLDEVSAVRDRLSERRALDAQIQARRHMLGAIVPEGVEDLVAAHARLEASAAIAREACAALSHEGQEPLAAARESAQAARDDAQQAFDRADGEHQAARETLAHHDAERGRLVGDVRVAEEQAEGARRQLADAEAALRRGEQEIGDDEAVRRAVTAASCALLEQRTVVESLDAEIESLGPEAAELRVQRADKAVRAARAEHEKLRAETSELRGKLLAGDLLGLHERLGCARSALLAADAQAQRLTERVEAVRLLHETLERRHALARQALLEPLQREIAPLARLLMPRAAVRIDDGLGVASVTRKEHGEDEFESLGGGSREQFGLLVRLAMAKVLGGDEPLPVMLDDSLVFTSSLRFEGVANLLAHVARSLQVIVFTCHWDRFRPLGPDRAIDLEQAKSEAAERAGEREA